jgi:hypothetical protein
MIKATKIIKKKEKAKPGFELALKNLCLVFGGCMDG